MTKNVRTKQKLKRQGKADFNNILDDLMLTDNETKMMKMYYINHMSIDQIADELGYSAAGIEKIHQRVLRLVGNVI
jgi:DNA-directed RNA polymerase specialized sigma subunit